jgi:hypothetical protein
MAVQCSMIGCISPNIGNCEQTLNTLRYADRVKERNPSTGDYKGRVDVASNQQVTKRQSTFAAATIEKLTSVKGSSSVDDKDCDPEAESQDDSTVSAMLDDLLSSPSMNEPLPPPGDDDDTALVLRDTNGGDTRKAASQLILCHKAAMTKMLEMLKDEMDIVNQVDGDLDGFEEYVSRVNEIQEEQLSYIVTMREQLLRYHAARNSLPIESIKSSLDDSFEDLRD